ncbi:MAG: hypothetical protein CL672_08580 [Balneola sp.]|nr:hypothetical protein [Balneola sp.]|tara:strand:+ start:28 stop:1083 length:1056 start_codon:yes stop_codon:yes gene_type:complete
MYSEESYIINTFYTRILPDSFFATIGFIGVIVLLLLASPNSLKAQKSFGQDRAGTEGFQFTKIPVDPRSAAMANSNMADAMDGSSLYWNPALSAETTGSEIMVSHTEYVAGIQQDYFSYIQRINSYAIGVSVQYLGSGDIIETTEFQPFGTGRIFSTHHMAAGLSIAQKVTDLFSYGLTFKYLLEKVEEIQYQTGAIDFGFAYRVGDTGLRFAVGINNFGLDAAPDGNTQRESLEGVLELEPETNISLPTRFHIGAAYDLVDNQLNKVTFTVQITNPSDNAEQLNIGAEYSFMDQFHLRTGYEYGQLERIIPSLGGGISTPFAGHILRADYAYTRFERLGQIHRIGVSISL